MASELVFLPYRPTYIIVYLPLQITKYLTLSRILIYLTLPMHRSLPYLYLTP